MTERVIELPLSVTLLPMVPSVAYASGVWPLGVKAVAVPVPSCDWFKTSRVSLNRAIPPAEQGFSGKASTMYRRG